MKKYITLLIFLFAVTITNAQTWQWGNNYGLSSGDSGSDITTDSEGNVYAVGRSSNGLEFNIDSIYTGCNYLVKYDSLGNEQWVEFIMNQSPGASWMKVATDSNNDIYVYDMLAVDTLVLQFDTLFKELGNFYVAKFDLNGTLLWARTFGKATSFTSNTVRLGDMDISIQDQIHFSGNFNDTIYFDNDTLYAENGRAFVLKMDISGNEIMYSQFGNFQPGILQDAYAIAADDLGATYVSGRFQIQGVFGIDTFYTQSNFTEFYLTKISPTGECLWASHATGINAGTGGIADAVEGFSLDWDNSDHIYVVGYYNSDIYFEDSTLLHPLPKSSWSGYLAKYDTTGSFKWVKHGDEFSFFDVQCDLDGNVYTIGPFHDSISYFDTTLYAPYVNSDVFASKFDSVGNPIWSIQIDGHAYQCEIAAPNCGSNRIYITGDYGNYAASFGGINLPVPNSDDIYVACIEDNSIVNCGFNGVNDLSLKKDQIVLYPNPNLGEFWIVPSFTNPFQIEIFDLQGRLVHNEFGVTGTHQINLQNLKAGFYLAQIESSSYSTEIKFIIER